MTKLITIFGATGIQGTSVIKHILHDANLSNESRIRGVTRDISKPSAQELLKYGVELVTANLSNPTTLPSAIQSSHTVILVTDYWAHRDPSVEFRQCKNVIDAANAEGVKHVIFSSLDSAAQQTYGKYRNLGHREGKARVEEYLTSSGMVWTAVLVGYYMSNFLGLIERVVLGEEEEYWLRYPFGAGRKVLPLVDAEGDVGLFVAAALRSPDRFNGRRILAAERYYSAGEIMDTFSQVTGKKGMFRQVTPDEFTTLAPEGCGLEYMETHLVINEYGYFVGGEDQLNDSLEFVKGKTSSLTEYFGRVTGHWS